MAERRIVTFPTLDRVMPDVDRLLEGHQTVGNWSLGQVCNHLTSAIVYSIDGFPMATPWIYRMTMGALRRRRVFKEGRMSAGNPLPQKFQPRPGLDARAEAEALRATLAYFAAHQGPWAMHPSFGTLTRDEWTRFHGIHCAHHLSFVLPSRAGQ